MVTDPVSPSMLGYRRPARADEIRVEPAAGGAYLIVPATPGHAAAVPLGLALAVALAMTTVRNLPATSRAGPWGVASAVLVVLLVGVVIVGCGLLAREMGRHLIHGPRRRRLFLTTGDPSRPPRADAGVIGRVRSVEAVKIVSEHRPRWVLRVRATRTAWGRSNLQRHDLLVDLPADRLIRIAAELRQALGIRQADHF